MTASSVGDLDYIVIQQPKTAWDAMCMRVRTRSQLHAQLCISMHVCLRWVSVSKCASYTVMNHICRIMQMPQHVETLQATSASKRVRKSPFIYLITHSTICYHILLHVLFPFLWMRVVGGGGGGRNGTMEERNKLQWQHLLRQRATVFQIFYHFTLSKYSIQEQFIFTWRP